MVGKPAGFWVRFGAALVDGIIVSCIEFPIDRLIGVDYNAMELNVRTLSSLGVSFTIIFLYYGWFYHNKGATPGKILMGLKVINKNNGKNLGFFRAFFRETLGKFCSAVIFFIGFLMVAFREDKMALHDLIFDTQVLVTKE
ncbi:MAG: RDD family protein [Bacteriovoracales bacterium]